MKHEMRFYRFNFNRKTYKIEAVLVHRNAMLTIKKLIMQAYVLVS